MTIVQPYPRWCQNLVMGLPRSKIAAFLLLISATSIIFDQRIMERKRALSTPSWGKPVKTYGKKAVMETLSLFYPSSGGSSVKLAPVLQFGSTPHDEALLYTIIIKEMPFVTILGCIGMKALGKAPTGCYLSQGKMPALLEQQNVPAWEDLTPQLVQRGTDYHEQLILQSLIAMWDELLLRWKAVTLSLEEDMNIKRKGTGEMPWLDVKFFSNNLAKFKWFLDFDANIATDAYLSQDQQMNYKYHINLGGSGGTSWTGTLSKLAMP
eukprot:10856881-Ditylum_brightwellii.AAC.1